VCRYEGLRHYIGANDRWSAVLYPPPGQIGITEPHFVSSSLRSPLIIMHNFSCEVEAALARDFVELWWRLNQDGGLPALPRAPASGMASSITFLHHAKASNPSCASRSPAGAPSSRLLPLNLRRAHL
jgi:hypothetical protein